MVIEDWDLVDRLYLDIICYFVFLWVLDMILFYFGIVWF